MIKLKIIIKTILSVLNRGKWYILWYIGCLMLYEINKDFFTDTYAYVLLLNIPIFLIPYLVLRKMDALQYYVHVIAVAFVVVWYVFYSINYAVCKDAEAFETHRIKSERYFRKTIRAKHCQGIRYVYNGHTLEIPPTEESERLYKIYGDSVKNHIYVRLLLKKALPDVYYIDDVIIDYEE